MTTTRAASQLDLAEEARQLADGVHRDPHHVLGAHPRGDVTVVRAFHPDALEVAIAHPGGVVRMKRVDERGLFEGEVPVAQLPGYRLRYRTADAEWEVDDPYRFLPTLGELDLHLIGEGTHYRLWERLGARVIEHQGVRGTAFAVWAPLARGVSLVSDTNGWDERTLPMRSLGASGVWEIFIPNVGAGMRYKYRVLGADGRIVLKADPLARAAEPPPATASVVTEFDVLLERRRVAVAARGHRSHRATRCRSTRCTSAPGGAAPTTPCSRTATWRRSSPTTASAWASPTSSCCPSPSIPSAARGATR